MPVWASTLYFVFSFHSSLFITMFSGKNSQLLMHFGCQLCLQRLTMEQCGNWLTGGKISKCLCLCVATEKICQTFWEQACTPKFTFYYHVQFHLHNHTNNFWPSLWAAAFLVFPAICSLISVWNLSHDRLVTSPESAPFFLWCIPLIPFTLKNTTMSECTCLILLWMIEAENTAALSKNEERLLNAQMCYIKCNFKFLFKL